MRDREPDFWRNLRMELAWGVHWIDRAIVLAYAAATGLVVVAFTLLTDAAIDGFALLRHLGVVGPWLPLLWTPALSVALLWWTRRFAPGASGSGIPQVVLALEDATPPGLRAQLVSLRLSLHKMALVAGGLLAGLSIGREGPTVQVGAGVMQHAQRWLSSHSQIDTHDLMVAGAAAGIAAAFNTPLGGVVFALEQLSRRRSISHSALVIASIVLSGLIAVSVFGNLTYFGELTVQQLSWGLAGPGLLVAIVSGLAGGLFSRLIIISASQASDRITQWRLRHPLTFAAICALAVAAIGMATDNATVGAGYSPTRALLEARAELPPTYTVFAPSLAIGAGIGHDIAVLTGVGGASTIPLIALGMVGFLAATTQGPITAFIIVMEMVSGHTMVLSLMATALLASAVARLLTRPMYSELADLLADRRGAP
jgi:H+/Cl- antiporter ClcA